MENQQSPSRYKSLRTEEAWGKLIDASEDLKLQKSLSDAQAGRVTEAIEVLRSAQTSSRRKKYKRFLYDVLRVSGPCGVLLCAAALGQVKAADMKNSDRVSFIVQIEINKKHTDVNHPILQSLAISCKIPTSHQSPNDYSPNNHLTLQAVVERSRKRKRKRASTHNAYPEQTTSPPATPEISLNNPSVTPRQEHEVLENASLQGIADVFGEYMCGAIRRDTVRSGGTTSLKAAVTMVFPYPGLVDCLMSLAIHQDEVECLAMALFNVRVESMGEVRHVVLNGGVRLTPNPEITLKGVLDEAIIRVFGPEIHRAITASRMRKKELEKGNHVTECVSMILTSSSGEGAIINLSLDMIGGARVQNKIYT
ncbi:hypothetical protein BDZ45DRAFT_666419 [Acephala macrosclerotiorum]|nr:hypothetical protein BDZ45DRAFT_666419 [Acephala macrosclerotiorum]